MSTNMRNGKIYCFHTNQFSKLIEFTCKTYKPLGILYVHQKTHELLFVELRQKQFFDFD